MNVLLDTHAVLWWLDRDPELSDESRDIIEDGANIVVVSAASVWEVAIKRASGKLKTLPEFAASLNRVGFESLSMTSDHAERAGALPPHHRDPFDRMLVAQAQAERLTILSRDPVFDLYDVDVRRC